MQFVDISGFQTDINWPAYAAWSKMVAIKATEGTGYTDPQFYNHRQGALSSGIRCIRFYHFARPDLNNPIAEAEWFARVVGPVRSGDEIALDYEKVTPAATTQWALDWLAHIKQRYSGITLKFYSYDAYIREYLQDTRLAPYDLWYANYTNDAASRPACPPPWSHYGSFQYTDHATDVPGISGKVDVNINLSPPIPPQEEGMLLKDSDTFFVDHFTRVSPIRIHCKQTGKDIANGILIFYMNTGGISRLPLSNEIALDPAKYPGVVIQICQGNVIVYDEKGIFDNPSLPGSCYLLKLDSGVGQSIIAKPLTDALQAQVVDLQKQIAALGTTPEAMQLAHLQSNIAQALKILTS